MRWGYGTVCRWASLCGVAAAAVALPASSVAGSGAPVRVGSVPRLARDAKVVGALAASVPLHVTVTLNPRDPSGLAAYAQAVSTPGSSEYRQYLTGAQFAERFGATNTQMQAVESSLRAHGLTPGAPSADRLSIPVTATAGRIGHAFSVSFRRMALPNGRQATVASAPPALDSSIAGDVQSVVGLSSVGGFHPQTQ